MGQRKILKMYRLNSTIKIKCKCSPSCELLPTLGFGGFNVRHAPEEIKLKAGTKKQLAQKKRAARNKVRSLYSMPQNKKIKAIEKDEKLEQWFIDRRIEMTGLCSEEGCGNITNKGNDKYYRWSCCHIVPKSLVPSVATNVFNFIELCQDHHAEFDNTFERAAKMKCFEEVKRKFNLFKHLIPAEELRKVNPYLKAM